MNIRPVARKVIVILLAETLLIAQAPAPQQPPPATPPVTVPGGFNLTNASLLEVIDLLARDLHINYILDAKVKGGSVTINTYGEVKALDLRPLLETILRMNGLAMVQVGNLYRIVPSAEAARIPITPQVNMKDFPDDERMLLNLVFLKFMTATEMENILKPFVGESANIVTYVPANLLMIEDNARNMKRTVELINIFDSNQFADQRVQLFTTHNSRPSDIVKELDTIFKAYALNEKTSPVKFLPIDRINTVIGVAANPGVFKDVDVWIKRLDVPVRVPVGSIDNYVYRLKYGRAENIGDVVNQLYGGSSRSGRSLSAYNQAGNRFTGQVAPGFGSDVFGNGANGGSQFNGNVAFGGSQDQGNIAPPPNPFSGAAPGGTGATAAGGTQPAGTTTGARDQTGSYLSPGISGLGGPRIIPNPYDNTLLVQANPQQWEQIKKLLDQLDVPPRQVLIDAKIYEVDLTGAFASGVEYYLQQKGDTSKASTLQLLGYSAAGAGTGLALSVGTLVGQSRQLLFLVSASASNNKARVISAPSIIATDSIPASINVGSTVPTLSAQAVSPGITNGGTSQFTQSITNQSTGVSLNILARVNASGIVTMVIDQSVSAPITNTSSGIDSPAFSQRNVSTQVTVEDGDTIAIGGIIQETQNNESAGIPGLFRIPYLGAAFGTKKLSKSRTELIIFLTPRVIYDTSQVAEATQDLRQKVKTLSNSIKEP